LFVSAGSRLPSARLGRVGSSFCSSRDYPFVRRDFFPAFKFTKKTVHTNKGYRGKKGRARKSKNVPPNTGQGATATGQGLNAPVARYRKKMEPMPPKTESVKQTPPNRYLTARPTTSLTGAGQTRGGEGHWAQNKAKPKIKGGRSTAGWGALQRHAVKHQHGRSSSDWVFLKYFPGIRPGEGTMVLKVKPCVDLG